MCFVKVQLSVLIYLYRSWCPIYKQLHRGLWYVSVLSTFPNTFALVLDSNLHDLNGTNPDWRCFQQNCHGVIYVQKQKFSEWPETSWNIVSEIIKNPCKRWRPGGPPPVHEGGGRACPPRACPPTSWAPWSSSDLNSNSIYLVSGRKKSERRIHRVLRYGADLESVLGSGEGKSLPWSSSTILHHQFHYAHRRAWVIPW